MMRRSRLDETKAEIAKIDKELASKLSDEKDLASSVATYQKRIEGIPTRESELTELLRDYDTLQNTYHDLLSKKHDSQIAANLERRKIGEQFRIIDPARVPVKPFSPDRPRLNSIGLAAGLAVGFALVALLEYLDRTVRSEADAKAAFNLLVLAKVPLMQGAQVSKRRRTVLALSVGAVTIATAAAVAWRLLK